VSSFLSNPGLLLEDVEERDERRRRQTDRERKEGWEGEPASHLNV
jgi:hypothetical protein